MTSIVDTAGLQLARRIRLERDARHWSLAELADRSGVASSTISKIERGEMSPTAALLVRLAGAFGLTLAGLLVRAEGAQGRLARAGTQEVWRDPATGYRRRQVFMRPDHPVEVVEIVMPAGQGTVLPASSYAHIRQVIWVQEGQLVVQEGAEQACLQAGDSLGFGPPAEVTIRNESAQDCRYLVVLARS